MPERELPVSPDTLTAGQSNTQEQILDPEVPGLPALKLGIGFAYSRQPVASKMLQTACDQLNVTVYTPKLGTKAAKDYVGGYHVTYTEPNSNNGRRIGIVSRHCFTGHTFDGSFSKVGFQNYPQENDILFGSDTRATKIPGEESRKYQINSFHQFGIILPIQISDTYPITLDLKKQLEAIVKRLDKDAQDLLRYGRAAFVISDPKYSDPIKVDFVLNQNLELVDEEVVIPGADAVVTIKNPKDGSLLIDKQPIKLLGKSDKSQSMKNIMVGGWEPFEPSFMEDKVKS